MIIDDNKMHGENDTLFQDMEGEDRREAICIMRETSAMMRNTHMPMIDPDLIADIVDDISHAGEHINLRNELMDH